MLNKKNLVIITSVLDTPNIPLSYSNIRSIYSIEQRYYQTLETIKSINEKIPDCSICIIECSNPDNIYVKKLENNSDIFFNVYNFEEIKKKIYSPFKGLGECSLLKAFFDNNNVTSFKNIFKISGRYKITDNFDYNNFDNKDNVFKNYPDSVATSFFKISQENLKDFIDILNNALNILHNGQSIENLFLTLLKNNFKSVKNKIGVIGNCAVDGNIIEH